MLELETEISLINREHVGKNVDSWKSQTLSQASNHPEELAVVSQAIISGIRSVTNLMDEINTQSENQFGRREEKIRIPKHQKLFAQLDSFSYC
jgi:hypothetical protein